MADGWVVPDGLGGWEQVDGLERVDEWEEVGEPEEIDGWEELGGR